MTMTENNPGMEGTTTVREADPQEIIESLRQEMAGLRSTIAQRERTLSDVRGQLAQREEYIINLGEALRAEAIRREWCGEYDAFAEEWDLPKRWLNFEVTMTITVTASDEETALDMVRGNVNLSSYLEGVHSGPEFEASEE